MKRFGCILMLLAFLLLTACSVSPQDSEASFAPDEEDRLVIYTSHKQELWWPIVQEFEERTGIWVEVVTGGSNELLERIAEESEAPEADVMFGGGVDTIEVYKEYLEPYNPSGLSLVSDEYRSPEGLWTPFSVLPVVLIYNTKLIDDGAISSWDDIMGEAYRGRIAFADPAVSGSSFTALVTLLRATGGDADAVLHTFADNLDNKDLESSGDVLTAVANGSYWIGITLEETALKRVEAGDSIALVYPDDGTSLVPDGTAIVKGAKHMDNAKLFLDFTLSRDVQGLLIGQYRRPVRSDIALNGELPDVDEFNVIDYDINWACENHNNVLMSWAFYLGGEETP